MTVAVVPRWHRGQVSLPLNTWLTATEITGSDTGEIGPGWSGGTPRAVTSEAPETAPCRTDY